MSSSRVHSPQAPSAVVAIRPTRFRVNPETAADNAFQSTTPDAGGVDLAARAFDEVTVVAETLTRHGVTVHLFDDEGDTTPDSVFPNNWFSTHAGGHIALYPMFSPNRRLERRPDVIELLKREYRVQDVIDYSGLEHDGLFLEGTGAMVLDHLDRVAYVCTSNRADPVALERFATHFNFEPMAFAARDENGVAVYHTNVLMCLGTDFALAGFDHIVDPARRREVEDRLRESGRELIRLDPGQVREFAGNAIELTGAAGRILALSQRARRSLRPDQIAVIERTAELVALPVPTIELAGGSVRCMLAGIHLSRRAA